MRRAQLAFAALAAFAAACAHGPSPTERRQAYFTCEGVSADAAANNLEAAGLAVENRSPGAAVKTGWIEASVKQAGVTEDLSLQVQVPPAKTDARFVIILAAPEGESAWDEVTEAHVESDAHRALLNSLRKSVCGDTKDYFATPD